METPTAKSVTNDIEVLNGTAIWHIDDKGNSKITMKEGHLEPVQMRTVQKGQK